MKPVTTLALAAALLPCVRSVGSVGGHVPHKCLNDSGSFSIDHPTSTGNNTLVVYHFPSASSRAVQFTGISYNDEYLLDGVDFDRYSGDVYVSAGARPAFFTNGQDLTGPSVLIRYNPRQDRVVWISNITETVAQLESRLGHSIGGFQDQAEDRKGNSYCMATWGNVLIKVDSRGSAAPFYAPSGPTNATSSAGFGGLFVQGDTMVISDVISQSFVVFHLRSKKPRPHFTHPTNVPAGYKPLLCDSLYAPSRYHGRIALCADDFVNGTGGIVAYASNDSWQTAEYVGIRQNDFNDAPNATVTATLQTEQAIYAVVAYIPGADGTFVNTSYFPIVDITNDIDDIVRPVLSTWDYGWQLSPSSQIAVVPYSTKSATSALGLHKSIASSPLANSHVVQKAASPDPSRASSVVHELYAFARYFEEVSNLIKRLLSLEDLIVECESLPDDRHSGLGFDKSFEIGYQHGVLDIEDVNAVVLPMDSDLVLDLSCDLTVPSLDRFGSLLSAWVVIPQGIDKAAGVPLNSNSRRHSD
ncbi:hypothetical protein M409DRAFT_55895 [Zasmidium cellare ATCC 36951]|uniref:Uncharacterized protein n=1 Tax=Zasmidium cellare ATCC 36951 TaxID=1080233 RepID=A0A6A6CH49_ZASCE|nr:uncharacterized protein M409DRAFT_55895 [Zasmidium cellare ATCC 36951]KAF2165518.1 hypothetical protein M409DRAFT_55895 [Zasmidium cellare ATCC 36951]